MGLKLVAFIGNKHERIFLSHPLDMADALPHWEFDAVVIADLNQAEKIRTQLIALGISESAFITL